MRTTHQGMECTTAQEALSARLDGEVPTALDHVVDAHVAQCPLCAAWSTAAARIHRGTRVHAAEAVPDLLPSIFATIGPAASSIAAIQQRRRACQAVLWCCAIAQLVITLPMLLGVDAGPVHLDRELGTWDLALGAGFAFAALRPQRAWGMLPVAVVMAIGMLLTGTIDVVEGHSTFSHETSHALELLGVGTLWLTARGTTRIQPPFAPSAGSRALA